MADFKKPERIKTALDNRKLNLSTPVPNADKKYSSLIWGMYANNPRITVFTNFPDDSGESKGYGKIQANMDIVACMQVFAMITSIADGPSDVKTKMENKNFTWFGGKRSDAPAVVSETIIGKDKDGIVWMSVVAPANQNRPRIRFNFGNGEYHTMIKGDGTPFTASEASVHFAKVYAKLLENMMSHMAVSDWVAPPPPEPRQGGNSYGGGNNNNRQGGGNSSYSSNKGSDMSDDIPF